MKRWEYTTSMMRPKGWQAMVGVKLDAEAFNDHLNRLGEEGWELVSVFDTNRADGDTKEVVAVFKRPRD